MKILHIHINEYMTKPLLDLGFAEAVKDIKRVTICGSKKLAIENLKTETKGGRIFWWTVTPFRGTDYFQLYETIYD